MDAVDRLNAALEGRYHIERELGEGGMATVYLADDLRHERKVAIKVLKADISERIGPERFQQEVRVTARLHHPHILPLHDSGDADGRLFYVMPYVDGESLKDRLLREGELPVEDVALILRDVVDALSEAHDAGVIHRDIKPANILLTGRHAFVADFGVAKAISEATSDEQLTTVGTSLGTPAYMSPEQAAGDEQIDARSDVYALGAMAYELLTGRPPFTGSSHRNVLMAHITQTPDPIQKHRPSVPPELAAAIMRCLEKRPADRWQSIDDLLPFLRAASTPSGGVTPVGMRPVASGKRWWTRRGVVAGAAVLTLGAAVGIVLSYGPQPRAPGPPERPSPAGSAEEEDSDYSFELGILPPENATGDPELDYFGSRLSDEMIREASLRAPELTVVGARDGGQDDAASTSPLQRLAAEGVSHALAARYEAEGDRLSLRFEVLDAQSGESLRVLDRETAPRDSIHALVSAAGSHAAIVALVLAAQRGDGDLTLRYRSLPPTVSVAESMQHGHRALGETRLSDAVDWYERALAEAPDFPGVYGSLISVLGFANQHERAAEVTEQARDVYPELSRIEQLYALEYLGMAETPEARHAARRELFRLTEGQAGGWALAFTAVQINELSTARAALDEYFADPDHPQLQGFTPQWLFNAAVFHLVGDYAGEMRTVNETWERFQDRVGRARFVSQLRPLIGLDSLDAARDLLRDLDARVQDPHARWHAAQIAALELRRHGYAEAASEAFQLLVPLVEMYPDVFAGEAGIDRAQAYYEVGRYEEAVPLLRAVLERDDIWWMRAAAMLVISLEALGRDAEALEVERMIETYQRPASASATSQSREDFALASRWAALVPASRGDAGETVRILREAFGEGAPYYQYREYVSMGSFFLRVRPELDLVADDPAFQALVRPR